MIDTILNSIYEDSYENYHTYRTNSVQDFFVIRDKFRSINLFTISISDNFIIFQIYSDRNYDWFLFVYDNIKSHCNLVQRDHDIYLRYSMVKFSVNNIQNIEFIAQLCYIYSCGFINKTMDCKK